jgi:gamma-glutamyl-gamma-aminobutyrate hydrolase PuuD
MTKVYIPSNKHSSFTNYINWLPNAEIVTNLGSADLILFAGGEDVHPNLYGQHVGQWTHTNPLRDIGESYIFQYAQRNRKKILGICRGSQFVTVMSGGNLLQHVPEHGVPHTAFLSNGKVITVASTHHQMMNPYVLSRDEYKLIGVSKKRIDSYMDGDNEVVPLEEDFLEPEIVYYPKTNALAIQGHPERQLHNSDHKDYVEAQQEIFTDFMNDNMEKYGDYRNE